MNFIKASGDWINRNWSKLIPEIMELVLKSEGVTPDHRVLNDMLSGFVLGALNLWLFVEGSEMKGFLVTSYGLGGPAGNSACYVRQLRMFETMPPEDMQKALEVLKEECFKRGCTHIIAVTDNPAVAKIAENYGAYTDTRMIWSVHNG